MQNSDEIRRETAQVCLSAVIAGSSATKQSHARDTGLLREACHRAALRADPLARIARVRCLKLESESHRAVVLAKARTHNHRPKLRRASLSSVMPGLVPPAGPKRGEGPGIHVFHMGSRRDVDGRDEARP